MARNYVQPGESITIIAPAILKSGDPVLVGALFGIAHTDAAMGAEVEVGVVGVWDLPKSTGGGTGLLPGGVAYWDDTAKMVTGIAATNMPVGLALLAAGDSATTVRVRLFGGVAGYADGAGLAAAVAATAAVAADVSDHEDRLTLTEASVVDHGTRLGLAETAVADHEGRITALEGA